METKDPVIPQNPESGKCDGWFWERMGVVLDMPGEKLMPGMREATAIAARGRWLPLVSKG